MKSLYDECIESFDGKIDILSKVESEKVMDEFQNIFTFTSYGRIDWDSLVNKITTSRISNIVCRLKALFLRRKAAQHG